MPVKLRGRLYQLETSGAPEEKTMLPVARTFTDHALSEQQLIYWITCELKEIYTLFTKHRVKTFSLREPIYADVGYRGKEYHFICQRVYKSELPFIRAEELPFQLKSYLFLFRPKRFMRSGKQQAPPRSEQITDLAPILNAVEHRLGREVRRFSPVLYTGMTN